MPVASLSVRSTDVPVVGSLWYCNPACLNPSARGRQEERIATLEQRYLNAQRESTALRDNGEKAEEELKNKEAQLKLQNEKILAIQEKLELTEQKLAQYSKLPDVEEELRRRMAALTQVRRLPQLGLTESAGDWQTALRVYGRAGLKPSGR